MLPNQERHISDVPHSVGLYIRGIKRGFLVELSPVTFGIHLGCSAAVAKDLVCIRHW